MVQVYVCYSVYHLLISLVKCSFEDQAVIILSDVLQDATTYQKRIEELFHHIEVTIVAEADLYGTRFGYTQEVHTRVARLLAGIARVNVFNDTYGLPLYLHRNRQPFHLIEDGYNALQHAMSLPKKRHYKQWLLEGKPLPHGFSNYCISIEVNDGASLPRDKRRHKFVVVPRKPLFDRLNEEQVSQLLAVFNVNRMTIPEWSLLVLTQPLAIDGYFNDETTQLAYYAETMAPYIKAGYTIYVKAHPRDQVDYSTLPVRFIEKEVPVELLDFIVDRPFAKGITAFSTALDFLQCVEEKQVLMQF